MAKGKNVRRARTPRAATADKYALYQLAVQDPPLDAHFLQRVYTKQVGRPARLMREDFCAAAALSCAWVRQNPENRAIGVDIDPEPLAWGREHNVSLLRPEQASRLELVRGDVLDDDALPPVDIVCAFNFSYFCFHERDVLGRYFAKSLSRLRPGGRLFLDLYGGADAQRTMVERREEDGFDYVWDQDLFDPIQHRVVNYIHFIFKDRSRLDRAFRYDWRLWTIPELRDLLREVGFGEVTVFWEGTDSRTGEGNGVYRPAKRASDDPAFVTYIVAGK